MPDLASPPAPPRLLTERLLLTLPGESDAPALLAYALRNDGPQRPWSPPTPADAFTEQHALRRIRDARAQLAAGTHVRFWLRWRHDELGPFVGALTLSGIELGPFRCARVGYHLDHECQGQGLMTEALRAVIRYAFDELRLHRLEASVIPTNERSVRVLERAGFVVEGYARKYLFIGGRLRDHLLTSLSNPALETPEAFLNAGAR
jgi:ribosomal-protein-alanine N-acetyltransferase